MPTSNEENTDESKDSFYEELQQVFDHFHKKYVKMLLGDLNEKWREKVFSNRQLVTRVYVRIIIIKLLE